jgi:hypothetical protein
MLATMSGNIEILQVLLGGKAAIDLQDKVLQADISQIRKGPPALTQLLLLFCAGWANGAHLGDRRRSHCGRATLAGCGRERQHAGADRQLTSRGYDMNQP